MFHQLTEESEKATDTGNQNQSSLTWATSVSPLSYSSLGRRLWVIVPVQPPALTIYTAQVVLNAELPPAFHSHIMRLFLAEQGAFISARLHQTENAREDCSTACQKMVSFPDPQCVPYWGLGKRLVKMLIQGLVRVKEQWANKDCHSLYHDRHDTLRLTKEVPTVLLLINPGSSSSRWFCSSAKVYCVWVLC